MLCPNCKQELMNVNGRYICVDCGIEIPENEVPVAQAEHDSLEAKVEGNDYLYQDVNSAPQSAPAQEPIQEESQVAENPEIPVSQLTETQPEVSVEMTPNAEAESQVEITPQAEPVVESQTASEPVAENPVPAESIPVSTTVPEMPAETDSQPTETPVQVAPIETSVSQGQVEETQPVPESPVDLPIDGEVSNSPVETVMDPTNSLDALSNSLNNAPSVAAAQPAPMFDTVNPAPVSQPAETLRQPVAEEPIAPASQVGEYSFAAAAAVPQDKTVYQNPIYDVQDAQGVETSNSSDDLPDDAFYYQQANKRKMILFSVLGVIGFLVLTIGGFLVYQALSTPAVVIPAQSSDIIDCGSSAANAGTNDKAKACFVQSFAECKLSKYSQTIDLGSNGGEVTYAYEITGKSDSGCNLKTQFTKNPNAAWQNKPMSCLLDNTKSFDEAIKNISADNCTGPLADLMFGNSTSSADNSTDTSGQETTSGQ